MKKTIAAITGLFLLTALAIFAAEIDADRAAKMLRDAIKSAGYRCDVEVADVDKNGEPDFAIEYVGEWKDDNAFALLAAVTRGVAELSPSLSWKVDKVFVSVGEDLYCASASKLGECYKIMQTDGSTEKEIKECLQSVWEKEEGAAVND